MGRRMARMLISSDYILDLLHLPSDTEIVNSGIDFAGYCDLVLIIRHDELPDVEDGARIPDIRPTYRKYFGDNGEIIRVERIDWGLPEVK